MNNEQMLKTSLEETNIALMSLLEFVQNTSPMRTVDGAHLVAQAYAVLGNSSVILRNMEPRLEYINRIAPCLSNP